MKIYTRTGDKGQSSLYNGQRVSKTHPILDALGNVDELNSAVGLAREYVNIQESELFLLQQLAVIQSRLLDVGSAVAIPKGSSEQHLVDRMAFDPTATEILEKWIDAMNEELPVLTQFILPSGGLASAQLHVARSICRRAERSVVQLSSNGEVDCTVAVFLNRLSDYFFVAARFMAKQCGRSEQTYKKAVS